MKILLAKSIETAKVIIAAESEPLITIEAVYGDSIIYGKSLTLDHHTDILYAPPALYNRSTFPISEKEYVLISHVDLDTIAGIYLCLYGQLPETLKTAINFIDENGMHKLEEIVEEESKAFIKAYRGYSLVNPAPMEEINLTSYIIKLIQEIFINKNHDSYIKIFDEYNTSLREKALKSLMKENKHILFFNNEQQLQGLNTLYDLIGSHDYIVTYNSHYCSITVSKGIKHGIDLKSLMQNYFGSEAGGHSSIAGTPRGMKFELNEANILFQHLTFLLQNFE